MHPTKELLLKHCIQFLGLQRQLAANPAMVVGDDSRFVDELAACERAKAFFLCLSLNFDYVDSPFTLPAVC